MKRIAALAALLLSPAAAASEPASVEDRVVNVGETGWQLQRPVMAAACPHACPWGEIGDFVHGAMATLGYDVVLCRNCNRDRGPRLVATRQQSPPLDAIDLHVGTTERINAPPDFGVTAAGFLGRAYATDHKNLRLIARIEDPLYLLVAVRADSGIHDLADIVRESMAVRVLAGGGAAEVLGHYGLTPERVAALGGSVALSMGATADAEFDVIIDSLGSSAMNPESSQWTALSQAHELRFLTLPEPLLAALAAQPDYEPVTVKWGFLRGIDREIPTVGRTGEVVFARDDTPDDAAYDLARAIDRHRQELKWYVRPYSYDPRTVWHSQGVPLHSGAERYYLEAGYMEGPGRAGVAPAP